MKKVLFHLSNSIVWHESVLIVAFLKLTMRGCPQLRQVTLVVALCGLGRECTGNRAPCQEWPVMGRVELRRPMEPLRSQSFRPVQASVYTSLLHFDFHITKRNWSRIQLFNNNVKHNLTPICHQGCERNIFVVDI